MPGHGQPDRHHREAVLERRGVHGLYDLGLMQQDDLVFQLKVWRLEIGVARSGLAVLGLDGQPDVSFDLRITLNYPVFRQKCTAV